MVSINMQKETLELEFPDYTLRMKRYTGSPDGAVIFMLHGSVENGKIFYSSSDKGLAPYLAKQGFDVFIPDLRGRSLSTPSIDKTHHYGQTDAITDEIPAFLEAIHQLRGHTPVHAVAHSWGGVLLLSYLARAEHHHIRSMVFFGTKRKITVRNWDRFWRIDILWNLMGELLVKRFGYLPAKEYKFGSDNEPALYYHQVKKWALSDPWRDEEDGFLYEKAIKSKPIPSTLYLTGQHDTHMGHPQDVQRLMREVGNNPTDKFQLLSKSNGFSVDYDHINILTHPKAEEEVYPLVKEWVTQHS